MEYIEEWDRPRSQPISYSQLQYQAQQSAMLDELEALKKQEREKRKSKNRMKTGKFGAVHQAEVVMRSERMKKKNKKVSTKKRKGRSRRGH